VTTSSMVGRSKSGCGLCPALSFKDLHHPCWGGGRAELELYLSYGPAGHLFLQHSGERELTDLAEGADFDNAGPTGRKRRQLQHAWLTGSAGSGAASGATSHRWGGARLSAHRTGGGCAVRTGGPYKTSHAARAAFVFLDCLVLTPARRLRVEVRAPPPVQEDLSGDLPVHFGAAGARWCGVGGQVAAVVGAEVVAAGEGFSADETVGATRGLTSGSLALIACPRPSSGDVGEGLVAAASALRSSLLLFSRPERRSLSLLLQWSAVSQLELVVP
jgi:hypothetical protein